MKILDPEKGRRQRLCSIEPMTMMQGGSALASMGGNIFQSIMGSKGSGKQADAIKQAAETGRQTALELSVKTIHLRYGGTAVGRNEGSRGVTYCP